MLNSGVIGLSMALAYSTWELKRNREIIGTQNRSSYPYMYKDIAN